MRLVLLGAPGSGKGTIAGDIAAHYNIPHVSSGDIFRANIRNRTPLGLQAESFIKDGALVPDSITIAMVEKRLEEEDCEKGFILDGFPRTLYQAEALETYLAERGRPVDVVLNIRLSDETIYHRLEGRRVCPSCGASYNIEFRQPRTTGICDRCGGDLLQRPDDRPETVKKRLETYMRETAPLIEHCKARNLLYEIDNEGESESVAETVRTLLAEYK